MNELHTVLKGILEWLSIFGPNMSLSQRWSWLLSEQHHKVESFLSEVREFEATATLALTIASRYV